MVFSNPLITIVIANHIRGTEPDVLRCCCDLDLQRASQSCRREIRRIIIYACQASEGRSLSAFDRVKDPTHQPMAENPADSIHGSSCALPECLPTDRIACAAMITQDAQTAESPVQTVQNAPVTTNDIYSITAVAGMSLPPAVVPDVHLANTGVAALPLDAQQSSFLAPASLPIVSYDTHQVSPFTTDLSSCSSQVLHQQQIAASGQPVGRPSAVSSD